MNDNKCGRSLGLRDFGGKQIAVNIDCAAKINPNYRTALWTGEHLQVTLMCIPVGEDIGAEVHCGTDQFLFVVSGKALAVTGPCRDNMHCRKKVECGCALIVPAGTWHNLINIGNTPLKVYSIYAPPQHPFGTVERTKCDAQRAEKY